MENNEIIELQKELNKKTEEYNLLFGKYSEIIRKQTITDAAEKYKFVNPASKKAFIALALEDKTLNMTTDTAGNDTFMTDDGKTAYGTITAGGLEWLAENIHFSGTADAVTGVALEEAEDASDIFGRFYTWDEAQTACASLGTEWRVPAISDWDSFLTMLMDGEGDSQSGTEDSPVVWEGVTGKLMTNAFFNGVRMWEYWPQVTITDEPVFCALPTGYANIVTGTFKDAFDIRYSDSSVTTRAVFWVKAADGTEDAVYKYIVEDQPVYEGEDGETLPLDKKTGIYTGYADRTSFGASIRCVREHTDGN